MTDDDLQMGQGEGNSLGITREHTVWCSTCAFWETIAEPTKKVVQRIAKRRGWCKTAKGWQCRGCIRAKR